MPQAQTVQRVQVLAGREAGAATGDDYDDDYRALDLPAGALLRDIDDRARLMRAAFDTSRLPPGLRGRTAARVQRLEQAAARLSQHWVTRGEAAPARMAHRSPAPTGSRRPGSAGDQLPLDALLTALAEALGTAPTAVATAKGANAAVVMLRPDLTSRQIDAPARLVPAPPSAPQPVETNVHRPRQVAVRNVVPSAATPRRAPIPTGAQHIANTAGPTPPYRRKWPLSRLGSLAVIGLVIVATLRLVQYRVEHLAPAGASEPWRPIAAAPEPPPANQWSAMAAPARPTGAFAPAIIAHQR